jgi:hypothetical protein
MLHYCYLRKGVVYVPTVAKTVAGFYLGVDPVAVVPVSHTADLRRALQETIARGNPRVLTPTRRNFPPPVTLKYAGVKTLAAFERGTLTWDMEKNGKVYQIKIGRKHPEGGWEEDPDQIITLPPGSGVDEVCDRMVAILQAHAG